MKITFTQQTSLDQHRNRFLTDDRCHQHLFAVRWPQGFACPACGHHEYYEVSLRKLFQCKQCHSQTSATAGTIMHRTRTPLRYWFWGIYYVAACNGETTAQQLAEKIGLNYYAARRMLGKIHEIEKNQGFLGDLLKSFKMPEPSREEFSTGPGMGTPPRPIKGPYPLREQTIPNRKKPEIPGYLLEEVIFESGRTWFWRGKRQSDGLLVLIKGPSSEQSAQELAEIRHEHEITQALEIDGVLRSEELVRGENGWALILENTDTLPLRKLMDATRLELPDSLKVAVSLIGILKEVHRQGILHKMINPFNIFVDPASGNIKLTGFGQATRLPKENLTTLSPQLSGETLPYISPEQTGRMNRVLDYRSDFYSLGATLYELFSGRVPFGSREVMEIIHAHIARQPVPLDQVAPQVPKSLSRLVMKLLAKRAETRYQSHSGLTADLLACVEQLENQGSLSDFPLGRQDVPKELQIAPGLYGREDEITALEAALERVSQGATEMMLISGSAGVGKTALVGEIHRSVAQKNGYLISGKFDQLRHNIPYSALIQALRGLTREIPAEDKSGMERWKNRIRAALGPNGQLITRVIPELEQMIGPQPPLPEMGALETRNRFTAVLLDFISVFCEKTHPLVIFLDDLQWVDADTLKLVERIAQDPERKPLLFLGAYRDNEVEADHRLTISCEVVKKTGQPLQTIPLKPLNSENISQLLVHTCHCRPEEAKSLAELLVRKTGGNPFFVSQFLTVLSEKELIGYSPEEKRWLWDLAAIEFLAVTENVVELLIDRLHRFSSETRRLLSLAACIGNTFDLESLELISGEGSGEIDENLLPALETGLILGFSRAPQLDHPTAGASAEGGSYKFLHDRVQQAAYALIAQKEKKPVHLQIGQTLLKQYAPEKGEDLLFDIVHHLNLARRVNNGAKERSNLAELNQKAGRQARAASAFEQALQYFTLGLELLGVGAWKRHYPLALSLHEEATEMSWLCGRLDLMEKLAGAVKDNAREDPDLANVYRYLIKAYTTQGELKKAMEEPATLSSGIMDQYHRVTGAEFVYHDQSHFNYQKLVLQTLFEEYEAARETVFEMINLMKTYKDPLIDPLANCYQSLALLAVCDQVPDGEKEEILTQVNDNQALLEKLARCAPPNYRHKHHLVEAERMRVLEGQSDTIMHHYDQAIALARESEFIHEEALANELAARYLLNQGQSDAARSYLHSAMEQYEAWGAKRKVAQLRDRYPGLIVDDRAEGGVSPSANLDLGTMLKASEAISSTLELEPLLEILLGILIENAGAQTAALILETEGQSLIAARGSAEQVECFLPLSLPVEKAESLSLSVISWVKQTREHLVLDNAAREERFVEDDYIKRERPKSILCAPITHQSSLSGIIYLENNLVEGAFTPRRLEVIKHLSSQIAISLENARLHENLKRTEAEYRGIFENATEGIYRTSQDGRFLSANPAMARLFGYSSPEELMASITDVGHQLYVNPERRHQFLDLIRQRRIVSDFEVEFFRKDGSTFWASLHARPIYDETGALRFIDGIISDITEQKNRMEALHEENVRLKANIKERYRFGDIIGKSEPMQQVYELILQAAATDVNVILYGETGTGKELVSKAIHEASDRKEQIFFPVNLGAIPENLIESEFFGYKKGAFTGATLDKLGYLDLAEQGTLFLDELGEIDLNTQAKLLRALEGGGFTPVGGTTVKQSDVRIIAATNRDLLEQVKEGLVREDFFYRVHVLPISLPSLRERKEDIPLLVDHFLKRYEYQEKGPPITGHVLEAMMAYDWPGNVRELQNTLHRYVTLKRLDFLGAPLRAPEVKFEPIRPKEGLLRDAVGHFEREYILKQLERYHWHRSKVASELGIDRRTLFKKMRSYGVFKPHNVAKWEGES